LGNLEGRTLLVRAAPQPDNLISLDKWIYSRLNATAGLVRTAIEGYRYNEAAQALYDYFWSDFCDWYVEATKLSFRSENEGEKDRAATVLLEVLEESLRLLHPYLPFVTEEIYSKLPAELKTASLLIAAPYPDSGTEREYVDDAAAFTLLQDLVRATRALRTDCGIDPAAKVKVTIVAAASPLQPDQYPIFCLLANASAVDFSPEKPKNAIGAPCGKAEVFVHTGSGVDPTTLVARFEKERANENAFADKLEAKLAGSFVEKAPPAVVAQEREKLAQARIHAEKLAAYIASLKGWGGK
jgi:valyl-tRNA synthetase